MCWNSEKGPVEPLGLLSKLMDPVGARKLKIDLGELMRTALSVRVADIRHVPALAKGDVPDVRGKSARSAAVSDTMLGTVLRMNEAGPSRMYV